MDGRQNQPSATSLEAEVVEQLTSRGLSLAVAESLTGGLLAAALTSVPGASGSFRGGVVTYCDMAKTEVLNVPSSVIERASAVSPEVAAAMARGAMHLFHSDWALATTGEAGPSSASGRAVGTAYVAICSSDQIWVTELHIPGDRQTVRRSVVERALELLLARCFDDAIGAQGGGSGIAPGWAGNIEGADAVITDVDAQRRCAARPRDVDAQH